MIEDIVMENCLFCRIAAGEIPSSIVYKDNHVVAFRDINPQAPQHILIIPKRHITSMAELTPKDGELLTYLFITAKQIALDRGMEKGYRFLTNVGSDGGQSVAHLHFHLLGGHKLGWTPG
jgi:histidine triad (HIT) family protein